MGPILYLVIYVSRLCIHWYGTCVCLQTNVVLVCNFYFSRCILGVLGFTIHLMAFDAKAELRKHGWKEVEYIVCSNVCQGYE